MSAGSQRHSRPSRRSRHRPNRRKPGRCKRSRRKPDKHRRSRHPRSRQWRSRHSRHLRSRHLRSRHLRSRHLRSRHRPSRHRPSRHRRSRYLRRSKRRYLPRSVASSRNPHRRQPLGGTARSRRRVAAARGLACGHRRRGCLAHPPPIRRLPVRAVRPQRGRHHRVCQVPPLVRGAVQRMAAASNSRQARATMVFSGPPRVPHGPPALPLDQVDLGRRRRVRQSRSQVSHRRVQVRPRTVQAASGQDRQNRARRVPAVGRRAVLAQGPVRGLATIRSALRRPEWAPRGLRHHLVRRRGRGQGQDLGAPAPVNRAVPARPAVARSQAESPVHLLAVQGPAARPPRACPGRVAPGQAR